MRSFRLVLISGIALLLAGLHLPAANATADPLWPRQYGPLQIGAPTAWQKSTGKGVKVAVIDSGVDINHPDLKANLVPASEWRDFACSDNNPDDDSTLMSAEGGPLKGHGTHVAGTIAAVTNNNIGVAGVAPDAKILPIKVFETNDACNSSAGPFSGAVTQAIDYAVTAGAKVINLSLISLVPGLIGTVVQSVEQRCRAAYSKGALCVIATGNAGASQASGYPRDLPAILVTANDKDGRHADFGQRADGMWGVSAPGVAITSTWPQSDASRNGYNEIQGTSMAAPHVSGAAALLFGTGLNATQVAEKLVATAGPARDTIVEGHGIIHVERALGLESPSTTEVGAPVVGRPVTPNAGRNQATGGSRPSATTSTTAFEQVVERGDFESGISTDDGKESFDELRLKEASRNSANKPFNAAKPLVGLSILALVVVLAVSIPRLRSKDELPPH